MASWRIIYSCPDCDDVMDLIEDEGIDLWCPSCERLISYASYAELDPPEYQRPEDDDHD